MSSMQGGGTAMKRKNLILIGVGLLMALFLLTACGPTNETITEQPTVTSTSDLPVTAEGKVIPEEDRTLAFESDGKVVKIYVEEGDEVQKGDVLAELGDVNSLLAQQASLNYDLTQAQQALDDLIQNADVDLEQVWQAVLDAKDAYDTAQKEYNDLEDQEDYDDDIADAEAKIRDAQKDVDDAQDDLDRYIDLKKDNSTRKRYQDILDKAKDTLDEKKRAKNDIEIERDLIISQFHAADAALQVAQSEYAKRSNGPDSDMLAQLNAQIDSINAQLTSLEDQLNKMKLTAPISGEVVRVNYDVQEFVSRGAPVIIVADTRHMHVESTDLTELEVAKLSEGQAVTMEADAFPGETFTGRIEQIGSYPQTRQGDVVYSVRITINDGELS